MDDAGRRAHGMRPVSFGEGKAVFEMDADVRRRKPIRTVHGSTRRVLRGEAARGR